MGYYVAGPPLLNGRCTSLLRVVVSKRTYTVSSGTLNSTIPYHFEFHPCVLALFSVLIYQGILYVYGTVWQSSAIGSVEPTVLCQYTVESLILAALNFGIFG